MNKRYLFVLWLFIPLFLFAQTPVSLQDCQAWAVAQSSANVQKELNEKLLKVKLNDAASHLYPTLEINGAISYQSSVPQLPLELGVDQLSRDQYGVSLDFSQVVFDGTKFFYGRKYERMMNKTEINKLELSINELKERIITIYLNLLIIDKQLGLLQSVENTIKEQSDQLKVLLKEGVVYANTLSELSLQSLKIEQQRGELLATRKSLVASLSILTGKDLTNSTFVVPDEPEVHNDANSSRLEYEIFENSKLSLDYQRKLHIFNSLPYVSIFATGGYGRPSYNFFLNNFDWYYMVGLKFKIPVISWAKTVGMGDIIQLQKQIVESKEADFRKYNRMAIQEKWNEIYKLENLLLLDKEITKKYSEITKTYKIQLLNGTITAYDFVKQQNDELQSLINQEMHTMQLLKAKFEFLALKGQL